jgi:hypothetical protein
MSAPASRHLDAAIELQKGARTVLSMLSQDTPSPERTAMVYLADAVDQLIEHIKEHQHTYWGPPGLASKPFTTQAQRDTGAAAHKVFLKQQAQKMKDKEGRS